MSRHENWEKAERKGLGEAKAGPAQACEGEVLDLPPITDRKSIVPLDPASAAAVRCLERHGMTPPCAECREG